MDVREKPSNKMRLIDANKLIDFIDVGHLRHPGELCYSEVDVANILLHAPTVDAVPVVRCRECKHCDMGVCLKIYSDGNVHSAAWQSRKPDDFCSYGERKNDEHEH